MILDVDYRAYSWTSREIAAEICRRCAALSDIVVGNDEELTVLADGGDGEALLAREMAARGRAVVYKMGGRGSLAFSGGAMIRMGVFPVAPLKPTGAGDAFMAGFVTGLAAGLELADCILPGSRRRCDCRYACRLCPGDAKTRTSSTPFSPAILSQLNHKRPDAHKRPTLMHIPPHDNANRPIVDVDDPRVPLNYFQHRQAAA